MKTFNRIFAAATAALIALTLGLTAADLAGADLASSGQGADGAPQAAVVETHARIG